MKAKPHYLYANEARPGVAGEGGFDMLICGLDVKVHVFFQFHGCHSNSSLVSFGQIYKTLIIFFFF